MYFFGKSLVKGITFKKLSKFWVLRSLFLTWDVSSHKIISTYVFPLLVAIIVFFFFLIWFFFALMYIRWSYISFVPPTFSLVLVIRSVKDVEWYFLVYLLFCGKFLLSIFLKYSWSSFLFWATIIILLLQHCCIYYHYKVIGGFKAPKLRKSSLKDDLPTFK